MKAKKFIVADTESTGLASRAFVFDFAYTIATRKDVILERSFLVREILCNPAIMLRAYFDTNWRGMMGGKIFADYIPMIARHEARIYPWREIIETLREDMLTHDVDVFSAYNLRFDMGALANTHRKIGNADKILPYRPDLLCLWEFACDTLCNTPMYHRVAHEAGWVSEAGNVRTNAEKVYAYLTQDSDFVEAHTALADAQIETHILQRLLARKKTIPYNVLDHMPWRKAQVIA